MNFEKNTSNSLEDLKINVKIKLAALWTTLMFLYLYIDYFHLYMPGKINEILGGKAFIYDISPNFLLGAFIFMSIPALMIILSLILPAKINRHLNIIIAFIYIPFTIYNLSGLTWIHMVIAVIIEVLLLFLIIYFSFKWPRIIK